MTTVSHALNGKGIVAEATRQKVLETARKLGYQPHAVARSLKGDRLGVLALVMRPLDSLDSVLPDGVDYFLRFAGAASLQSLDHGFGLMLTGDPTSPGAPRVALAADGFIIVDPVVNDPVLELLMNENIPFVTVGRDPARDPTSDSIRDSTGLSIDIRTEELTLAVLEHLKAQGARNIALATGTDLSSWNLDSEAVYVRWCEEQGQDPVLCPSSETNGENGGAEIAADLLHMANRPDALYCLTGRHAFGALRYFQDHGVRVPDDILLVGGSDCEQTRSATPRISSLELEPETVARRAAHLLATHINTHLNGQLDGGADLHGVGSHSSGETVAHGAGMGGADLHGARGARSGGKGAGEVGSHGPGRADPDEAVAHGAGAGGAGAHGTDAERTVGYLIERESTLRH